MIYTKPFISVLLLLCIISTAFAQSPTEIESINNNSTSLTPTPTEQHSNSSSTTTSITATPTSLNSSSISITTTPIINSISSTTSKNNAVPTVQSTGWNSKGNEDVGPQQSWLKQHNRFVFVIVLGLLFLALLIWYIVRSIKGMRKRLEQENQAQLFMMQQATSPQQYQQQQQQPAAAAAAASRNDRVIPELTQTPPPAYKIEEHPQQNNDHSRF